MTYRAEVTREGRWWMVAVPEIDGLTQARHIGEAELMARELIAVTLDVDLDDVAVDVHVMSAGKVREIDSRASAIKAARVKADALEREASAESERLAHELVEQEVSLRDIGAILGVSHQRAHQLASR